jgi:ankyrin repeat protein
MPSRDINPSNATQPHGEVRVKVNAKALRDPTRPSESAMIWHSKPDPPELTELHAAIAAKNLKKIRELISRGVDVNALHSDFELGFPLEHSLDVGDVRIIRSLLDAGADPNRSDCLFDCVEKNKLAIAKLLITYGANVNGQPSKDPKSFETNVIRATRLGRTAFVKCLFEAGADPNIHNEDGESALLVARMMKNRQLIKLLEGHVSEAERAWVDERFSAEYARRLKLDGEIREAIRAGQIERVIELVRTSNRPLDTPLIPDFLYPLEEALSTYFETRGKSPFCPPMGFRDWTTFQNHPVHDDPAVQIMVKMVKTLIEMCAPVDKGIYSPPLDSVTGMWDRNIDVLLMMLQNCNDVDARSTMDRTTPLMSACVQYQIEMARVLLAHGADPNARNIRGESVLQRARCREQYVGPNPCVPLLLEAGAQE